MKKITLFAFVVAALSLASCKKDRTCTCTSTTSSTTVNSGSNPATINTTDNSSSSWVFTINKEKKSIARPACLSTKKTDTDVSLKGTIAETTTTEVTEKNCTLN
jgi:hypothetical protein